MDKEYLSPRKKLVLAVVDWLLERGPDGAFRHAEVTPSGALSLEHVMVVVPTAQAGRRLRLALAKACSEGGTRGLVPPRVTEPTAVIRPVEVPGAPREAVEAELKAAFLSFVSDPSVNLAKWPGLFLKESGCDAKALLGFLEQLNDIWHALAGDGLLMQDVLGIPAARTVLESAEGNELQRWQELGSLERDFFGFLETRGLRHPFATMKAAKTAARSPPAGTRMVVLPALADPIHVFYSVLEQWMRADGDLRIVALVHADERESDRFDEWGRPEVSAWTGVNRPVYGTLRDEDVIRAPTNRALAEKIARRFGSPDPHVELPSLGLADAEIYPELQAAFLNRGYLLHNPERHLLAASSLGALMDTLVSVWESGAGQADWAAIRTLFRTDDVMSALCRTDTGISRTGLLLGLDTYSNTYFPLKAPSSAAVDALRGQDIDADYASLAAALHVLERWFSAAREAGGGVGGFVRSVLDAVYGVLDPPSGSRRKEFSAACDAANTALDALDGLVRDGFAFEVPTFAVLAREVFAAARYQLEPDGGEIVKTEGWLELAWSPARLLAIAGFREGAVPDSLIGHAFLPDSLREALGLTCNRQRYARDVYLLGEQLGCRAPGEVLAFVALANAAGEIQRPSRLLFLCSDADLPRRVERLFASLGPSGAPPPRLPAGDWAYRWPDRRPPTKYRDAEGRPLVLLSPSAIDEYIRCPFTYMLKYVCGMRPVKEKDELGADDFGTLVHKVMETFTELLIAAGGRSEGRRLIDAALVRVVRSVGEERETAFDGLVSAVRGELARLFDEETRKYGSPTAGMKLQLDAARGRILASAKVQAGWLAEGWLPIAAEYKVYDPANRPEDAPVKVFDGFDVGLRGTIDRIDYNPQNGYRVIDYKTWDDPLSKSNGRSALSHVFRGGKKELDYADSFGYPVTCATATARTDRRMVSVQLPLYAAALEKKDPARFRGRIADLCYLVLGDSAEHVVVYGSSLPPVQGTPCLVSFRDLAMTTARRAVRGILSDLFWPPSPCESWKWDFGNLFMFAPEKESDAKWVEEQTRRFAAFRRTDDDAVLPGRISLEGD